MILINNTFIISHEHSEARSEAQAKDKFFLDHSLLKTIDSD